MERPMTSMEEYQQRIGRLDFQKTAKDIITCEHYLSEMRHGLTYLRRCQEELEAHKHEMPLEDYRDQRKRLKRWRQGLKRARYEVLKIQELNLLVMSGGGHNMTPSERRQLQNEAEARRTTTMANDPSIPPSKTLDDNAQELTATLRTAFDAWVHRDARDPSDDEVWIATELLVKGIFGFAAPLLVNTLNLQERGAQTMTQWFAEHLDRAVQERRHLTEKE
jgi:hypothetical protein